LYSSFSISSFVSYSSLFVVMNDMITMLYQISVERKNSYIHTNTLHKIWKHISILTNFSPKIISFSRTVLFLSLGKFLKTNLYVVRNIVWCTRVYSSKLYCFFFLFTQTTKRDVFGTYECVKENWVYLSLPKGIYNNVNSARSKKNW
jgi:hypothetical protein